MRKNKILIIFLLLIISTMTVSASENYNQVQGDSVFVVGVEWQKISETDYYAYVTVDLNYNQLRNPLENYAIVEQYNWNNWFLKDFRVDDIGTYKSYIDENGDVQTYFSLIYYWEIPDTGVIENCEDNWRCDEGIPNPRIGYYGLPFYIQEIQFFCDINNIGKGSVYLQSDNTQSDVVNLIRPNYEGLKSVNITNELPSIPLGWITDGGKIVRYTGIPIKCEGMDNTDNSQLYFKLRPNNYYRHIDPDITSSDTWEYSDIINSLPSINNKDELPFSLDIDFNFTGDYWNYTVSNEEQDEIINNLFGEMDYDMDCIIEGTFGDEEVKYSELTESQKLIINTGEGISCKYATSKGVTNVNNKMGNDILQSISYQNQREVLIQLDYLDKQLETKRFITNSIIPFFAIIVVLLFYIVELFVLGIVFLGLFPMMANQFIKGLKKAFDLEEIGNMKLRRND